MSLSEEIQALGAELGLEALALNDDGVAEIVLDSDCSMSIEALDEEVVVIASWRRPNLSGLAIENALRGVWLDENSPLSRLTQVGLVHDGPDTTLMLAHRSPAVHIESTLLETWTAHFLAMLDAIKSEAR